MSILGQKACILGPTIFKLIKYQNIVDAKAPLLEAVFAVFPECKRKSNFINQLYIELRGSASFICCGLKSAYHHEVLRQNSPLPKDVSKFNRA